MGLDIIEIVLDVEEEFEIKISNLEATKIESIGDLYDIAIEHVLKKDCLGDTSEEDVKRDVWGRLKNLLIYQLDLKPEQIIRSNRFFHELGFN